ncbi:murein hydrolase activator EnvC family protein [Autumnicola musiva]|uniref:Peptidoglycan DD-metalloendopeptidase family protein n=1 Tax=Autumnicola musiva TaxID=3075589 RepID=A0ABU3D1C1_9FLAO|nr:peptidoglycan DD-metalloendopeptidase family protein [Zunongwangia sp. F117]MDT0675330.1 peptidoglycan DD-metalloendopeptidase family protein [Zunongwangia sp. F117]
MRMKKFTHIFLLFITFGLSHGLYAQTNRETLEKKRLELRNEIRKINELRSSNKQKEKSVLTQVEDLNQQIKQTENLINVTDQQANLLTQEINENSQKISALRKELQQLKDDYAGMIQKSYKSKSQQSRIMFLLSSENFLQAYKRLQYMKQYTNYRKEQGEQIRSRTEDLQRLNKNLANQKQEKEKLIAENRNTRQQLEENRKAQQALMATINEKEGQFAAQIKERQQEINRIDQQIEEMVRASIAKANEESGSTSRDVFELTPAAKALAADFANNKGKLPWPVRSGVVTMSFGQHRHPIVQTAIINNNGVNIDTDPGGKARAVFNGTVSEVQLLKGANKAVMVRHGDYITIYDNLDEVYVKRGDVVSTEQEIGEVATNRTTGKTTLHFLIFKNTQKMNPADWIYQM